MFKFIYVKDLHNVIQTLFPELCRENKKNANKRPITQNLTAKDQCKAFNNE